MKRKEPLTEAETEDVLRLAVSRAQEARQPDWAQIAVAAAIAKLAAVLDRQDRQR